MLSNEDLAYIKLNRREITENRTQDITITLTSKSKENPFTGEITETNVDKDVASVVIDRTSRTSAERRISNGAEIVEGDIWFSIDTDEFLSSDNPRTITKAIHDNLTYEVLAHDPKGIGELTTRWEFVGKRVV